LDNGQIQFILFYQTMLLQPIKKFKWLYGSLKLAEIHRVFKSNESVSPFFNRVTIKIRRLGMDQYKEG